ncbi:MAG: type II toxin-antitoxin system RelE/ParE family toxin [Clostridiales bacterium]|nr:type II toxin-antitoxin system RelE/ParE family toxin [Clostridiales bacterium]
MNKEQALQLLLKLLSPFQDTIWVHESVIKELMSILRNSGAEKRVFDLLVARLKSLQDYWNHACDQREFELLGGGIYSMHIAAAGMNIRILYAFADSKAYLLHAFYEREGKNHTDYTGKVKLAQERLDELKD